MIPGILRGKKGQVTIFVILAILIVVLAVLVFLFLPKITSSDRSSVQEDPQTYLENCIQDDLYETVETISENGGLLETEFSLNYQGEEIEYLCYTNEYLKPCIVQKPLLTGLIKSELKSSIEEKVNSCFDSMKESFENKNYDVSLQKGDFIVELYPSRIEIVSDSKMSISKDTSQNYEEFVLDFNSDLYTLASIAYNILAWESTYGDAATDSYMAFDPTIKIEKIKTNDGSKVYKITSRETLNSFRFASRSMVWPSGVGV